MIKIKTLIAALQEEEKRRGNIDLEIGIIPQKDVPKEGYSKYLHIFGLWHLNASDEKGKCAYSFEFNEDKVMGDWLQLVFSTGKIDGDFERLSQMSLIDEVNRSRKIDDGKA